MKRLRLQQPSYRSSPKVTVKYKDYKPDLREDFFKRCGYCNDLDRWCGGHRFYQLDHFIPKKYLDLISEYEYSNLVYSCFFCNNSKRAKWPSGDETISIVNNEGFVNPVEASYENHLERIDNGTIVAKTPLGQYMIKSLKLYLRRHAILFSLEQLDDTINKLRIEYSSKKNKIDHDTSEEIIDLLFQWSALFSECMDLSNE